MPATKLVAHTQADRESELNTTLHSLGHQGPVALAVFLVARGIVARTLTRICVCSGGGGGVCLVAQFTLNDDGVGLLGSGPGLGPSARSIGSGWALGEA